MDTVFRQAPPPAVEQPRANIPEPEKNIIGVSSEEKDIEPIDVRESRGGDIVLEALGIEENVESLPEEDKSNLKEVKEYVKEIIKAKGSSQTFGNFKKTLEGLKAEMGLEDEAEPSQVLDRIAGVVKAWRNISFIKDPIEKRRIFMKLGRMKSSSEMNREVFNLMSKYQIWQ